MIVLSYKIPPVSYRTFLLFDISLYTLLFFYLRRKMYRITFVKKIELMVDHNFFFVSQNIRSPCTSYNDIRLYMSFVFSLWYFPVCHVFW